MPWQRCATNLLHLQPIFKVPTTKLIRSKSTNCRQRSSVVRSGNLSLPSLPSLPFSYSTPYSSPSRLHHSWSPKWTNIDYFESNLQSQNAPTMLFCENLQSPRGKLVTNSSHSLALSSVICGTWKQTITQRTGPQNRSAILRLWRVRHWIHPRMDAWLQQMLPQRDTAKKRTNVAEIDGPRVCTSFVPAVASRTREWPHKS